ncbi:flagellar biosynthetic protein FliP [Motilibacter peucedani]|uniref:Flagellar biosynthetic protein FliP n=1 Tax=Motilibacter peucedani TaxID=598650 RepID=A0A420XTY3_9ACTN|nr:flagellar type III secretion system pore protein FliP [Motilibacter peucedani]RKS80119.1 flagellar biosynthetic protein FliP [Motilibacter peucedani]
MSRLAKLALATGVTVGTSLLTAGAASAAPTAPKGPTGPTGPTSPTGVTVDLGGIVGKPSTSLTVILAITLLSVAPALLLMCTCFTKVFVVLGLTRNALGVQNVPPNQVLAGLALFISLFVMAPVLSDVNKDGVQPYLKGDKTQSEAFKDGVKPLQQFMVKKTRKEELALFTKVAQKEKPKSAAEVPLTTLVPAFVLSELKSAFIIGFIIFIPFLVIDIVVSAGLMSMGMMMLPPVMISLPFKLLLFVLVDGWGLVISSLVSSYH